MIEKVISSSFERRFYSVKFVNMFFNEAVRKLLPCKRTTFQGNESRLWKILCLSKMLTKKYDSTSIQQTLLLSHYLLSNLHIQERISQYFFLKVFSSESRVVSVQPSL